MRKDEDHAWQKYKIDRFSKIRAGDKVFIRIFTLENSFFIFAIHGLIFTCCIAILHHVFLDLLLV